MAIRDIYETGFDEDVEMDSSENQSPHYDLRQAPVAYCWLQSVIMHL